MKAKDLAKILMKNPELPILIPNLELDKWQQLEGSFLANVKDVSVNEVTPITGPKTKALIVNVGENFAWD